MKKIVIIMLCSICVLTSGVAVAYYNTETTGFDSEAKIIARDDEKISVMNREIYYKDVQQMYEKISRYIPKNVVVIELKQTIM